MVLPPMKSGAEIATEMLKDLHELFGCGMEVTENYVHITFPPIEIKIGEQR